MTFLIVGGVLYLLCALALYLRLYRSAGERDEERDLLEPYAKWLNYDRLELEEKWRTR